MLVAKFYNCRVSRPQTVVAREVAALLRYRPTILGLCEATGYDLPRVPGFRLTRDTSTASRANIAAYVAVGLARKEIWHDLTETWSRTQHHGTHEPRSWLEVRVGACQFMVGHQPPQGTDNTRAAQQEGITLCDNRMAPWHRDDWDDRPDQVKADAKACPRIALADWNRRPTEGGPGPEKLAAQLDGSVAGRFIDAAVYRGRDLHLRDVDYQDTCAGVPMKTDHPWGALVVKVDVKDRWVA